MSNAMAEICAAEPNRHIVGLFHNLHIKKKGSSERKDLWLPSIAELLFSRHRVTSYSVGLNARRGAALHNNLEPFDFMIEDRDAIECLPPLDSFGTYKAEELSAYIGYHHAFDRETIHVRTQYDEVVVLPIVSPPTLIL